MHEVPNSTLVKKQSLKIDSNKWNILFFESLVSVFNILLSKQLRTLAINYLTRFFVAVKQLQSSSDTYQCFQTSYRCPIPSKKTAWIFLQIKSLLDKLRDPLHNISLLLYLVINIRQLIIRSFELLKEVKPCEFQFNLQLLISVHVHYLNCYLVASKFC